MAKAFRGALQVAAMIDTPSAEMLAAIRSNFKISGIELGNSDVFAEAPPSNWKEVAEKTAVAESEETRVVKKARVESTPCV